MAYPLRKSFYWREKYERSSFSYDHYGNLHFRRIFYIGPGAAGLTLADTHRHGLLLYRSVTFLVLGVLGNKLAMVSKKNWCRYGCRLSEARYKVMLSYYYQFTYGGIFMAQMIGQFLGGATLISSITGLIMSSLC